MASLIFSAPPINESEDSAARPSAHDPQDVCDAAFAARLAAPVRADMSGRPDPAALSRLGARLGQPAPGPELASRPSAEITHLDRESDASLDVTVLATSSDGSTASETFAIAVSGVDEFDVSTPVDSTSGSDLIAFTTCQISEPCFDNESNPSH